MKFRFFSIILAVVLVAILAVYFLMSHSYKLSLQAKVNYYLSDYDKAYTMAKEAYADNSYNRMAATVMTQSKLALEYVQYNNDAKEYLAKIAKISQQKFIEKADKIRMKFMSEIMMKRFPRLTNTVVIDSALKEQSKKYFTEFEKIYEKVTKAL